MNVQTEAVKSGHVTVPWAYFRLRPFPQIAIRVIQLVNREEVPLFKLSALISSDPAFAGEVLTVANSPLFAPRFPATNVFQAVARLGMQNIQGLCLTVAVRAYLGKSLGQPAMRHIWRHNLACALTTERIAAILGMDKDVGFTSGVMHDIGRLALAALQPAEYSALLVSQQGPAVSILDPEHDLFGFDHCEAGRELIADWRLPSAFESIVSGHHDRPSNLRLTPAAWMMSDVVNLGCRLADTLGFPAFTGCETQTFDDLVAEMPAAALYPLHWNEKDLGAEIAARIGSLEHA